MMQAPQATRPARFFRRLSAWVFSRPRLFIWPQIALLGLAVFYSATTLQFDSDRNDLVGAKKKYHQNFLRFEKEFGGQDDMVAIAESEDPEKNRQFVERLGAKLEAETNLFSDVLYKGDLKMMGRKALFLLPDSDLKDLAQTLKEYAPFIESFARTTNLDSLFRLVNHNFRAAAQTPKAANQNTDSLIRSLPALTRIVSQADSALHRPGTPPSPGLTALFNAGEEAQNQQYITFDNGRIFIATARARTLALNDAALKRMRALLNRTQLEVPGVNAGLTGEYVLDYDEMAQSQRDSTVATLISLGLCSMIFIYAYREIGRPLKAVFCLIIGLGYTLGFTTLTIGHLNILTITFLPMLIGLAIDFGVHLITRYEEEIRHRHPKKEALEKAMVNTGLGIFTGCLTTAGAFFAMAFTDFKGIQEMGVITGGGMIICLIPMMTTLPALLLRGRATPHDLAPRPRGEARARIETLWLERPWWVVGACAAITLFCLCQFPKVYFDYNLLDMQSQSLPSVVFDRKLTETASKSVLYGAVVANTPQQALALQKRLDTLPSVASVESAADFLLADQPKKIKLINDIKAEVAPIHFAPYDSNQADAKVLSQTLFYTRSYLGLALPEVKKEGDTNLIQSLQELSSAINNLAYDLSVRPIKNAPQKLAAFQQALYRDLEETFETLKTQDTRTGLRAQDLPPAIKNRLIGKTGKFLLQVYPKKNIWQRANQKEFVMQIQSVDPNATGTPVQLYYYTTLLKQSYEKAALYALAAIAFLVFLHFGAIGNVLLALLPVALGSIWMVGFMGFADIPFNPANIMTLPLVIGIGVTNGIQILNRFAEEQNPHILAKSTGKAVLVSGLNTIAGFGSLIQAKHEGIKSLGIVMSVGVATCMIAALTVLPTLLNLLIRYRRAIKKPSGDNALSPLGREEPR